MLPFLKVPTRRLKRLARKSSKWPIGYAIIVGVLITRSFGLLANLELQTLDFLLQNRLSEELDEEIVIILFERSTLLNQSEREDLTEQQIAQLLKIVLAADPAAVGLNIFLGGQNTSPGREQLIELFKTHPNLFGVQKVLPPRKIDPPQGLPEEIVVEQFGMNDVPPDQDGRIRRTFLGSYLEDVGGLPNNNPFKFSFSFKLAEAYLGTQGYALENHPRQANVPIFKLENTSSFIKLPILNSHSGGYHRETNISDLQSFLNYRSGPSTFQIINAFDLFNRSLKPDFLEDKVVIVGHTDSDFPRFLPVAASSSLIQGESDEDVIIPRMGIVGAELEAHSASQLIEAVMADRPLLFTLPGSVETLLIIGAGLTGILVSLSFSSSARSAVALLICAMIGLGFCYWCLLQFGLLLPVTPMAICLPLAGITYLGFNYRSQRRSLLTQRAKLRQANVLEAERQKAIERAFSAIHAGPLQRLSRLLRSSKDGNLQQEHIVQELESLNKEIRGVGERLRQEAIGDVYFFYSEGDIKLDLTHPMHEVLYEVYSLAVQRKLPGFETIKVRAVAIEPFNCKLLNLDIKRQLCWFLEESLQNIGKHAVGTTRIQVSGKHLDEFYSLKIEDNGPGIQSAHVGEGTQSFYRLETLLRGKFARFSKPNGGTICELSWPSSFNTS
ncbi:CHASE2 domain-containing protein [Halomicronema sp. CCY15110]|uniref:sensor histidine kinase n=1 Tax=Halomicronema sp. CCY15110 TaxID=2767773 RepID=UPI0019520EC8|nr:CHASE2 domain-containing protein [Halomicronema sp. CCY15110]